jgi:predicted nucleotidyltransferase
MIINTIEIPLEKIADFCDRWQVNEFCLFGSVLRHDFRPDSDIDVLIDFDAEAKPTLFDLVDMEEQLQEIFHRDIDLVTRPGIENSDNYLRRQAILSTAQPIYGKGSTVAEPPPTADADRSGESANNPRSTTCSSH